MRYNVYPSYSLPHSLVYLRHLANVPRIVFSFLVFKNIFRVHLRRNRVLVFLNLSYFVECDDLHFCFPKMLYFHSRL